MVLDKNIIREICYKDIKNMWLEADDTFPGFLPEVSPEAKAENESYINRVIKQFETHIKGYSSLPRAKKKWKLNSINFIKELLHNEDIIGIHNFMSSPTIDAYIDETKDFLLQVRFFAPKLKLPGIGQAIRNYLVYVMFKELHLVKSDFSMPAFGYSMLYPFTDNYIDSDRISDSEKRSYNQTIRDKIEGKPVHTRVMHHIKTCDLLQTIEVGYPRESHSVIYELLLMMLEAQENSIRQQHQTLLSWEERLDISLYKGGVSVLIDRFFVNKEISREDLIFYLAFGFFLQLADDLQDIREDSQNGNQTLFTLDLKAELEEKVLSKMFHFLYRIITDYKAENTDFKSFVLNSSYLLMFISIADSKDFFSEYYLNQLDKHLPFSLTGLNQLGITRFDRKDAKTQKRYLKLLDELIK